MVSRSLQGGFTYLGVLLAIALLGLGLTAASEVWVMTAARQRIEQLEWAGQQYQMAIGSYYEATPGLTKSYPKKLDDLLSDARFPFARRHLRQLYANPMDAAGRWEIVEMSGVVRGVRARYSLPGRQENQVREFSYSPFIGSTSDPR